MPKSKAGKSKGYVSSGINSNVSKKTRNAVRREYMNSPARVLNQIKALRKGKDVVVTVPNPNKEETNKRFIKKRISAHEYNLTHGPYSMKQKEAEE